MVGDPDQTIYTFTGATPEFLLGFAERHPGARTVTLAENYRSSPQILELANRLVGRRATRRAAGDPAGRARPAVHRFADAEAELREIVAWCRAVAAAGVAPAETAVLVRVNAQLPAIEDALTRAGIGFTVRGQRFFDRREVREALRLLRRDRPAETGGALVAAVERLFVERLGLDDVAADAGSEGRERAASLELLLGILEDLAAADPALAIDAVLAELDRRQAAEAADSADGVNLLTYHRAKGLEWDAVYLPALDEGLLPIRQAKEDEEIAEERRLLYVGITRARRFLALCRRRRAGRRGSSRLSSRRGRPHPARRVAWRAELRAGRPAASAFCPARRWPRPRSPTTACSRRSAAGAASAHPTDGVPAYVVAHDTTLAEIADVRPRSLPALRRVRGMGPTKLERYGPEILAVIDGAS